MAKLFKKWQFWLVAGAVVAVCAVSTAFENPEEPVDGDAPVTTSYTEKFDPDEWRRPEETEATEAPEEATAAQTSEEPEEKVSEATEPEPEKTEKITQTEPKTEPEPEEVIEESEPPKEKEQEVYEPEKAEHSYVLNTNTMKFHYPDCSSVGDIKPYNREDFSGTRDEAIARGFSPCGRCKP